MGPDKFKEELEYVKEIIIIGGIKRPDLKSIKVDIVGSLLIAKILTRKQIEDLYQFSNELNLDVLIEIESIHEISKIENIKNSLIGINNRNLKEQKINIDKSINGLAFEPIDFEFNQNLQFPAGAETYFLAYRSLERC